MKIHTRPLVILVTRPSLVMEGVAELLAEYNLNLEAWRRGDEDLDGDSIPELMGRLCYGSFGSRQGRVGARDYIANILASGHGSVLEHACWGFVVCRASRGYTHQMVRHRAGFAYSQESQHFIRYSHDEVEKGSVEAGICTTGIPDDLHQQFVHGCEDAVDAYARLWRDLRDEFPEDAKVKKIVSGAARGLLPNALESRLGFTANARALRHFTELRGTPDNVLEIRLVAVDVARIMKREAPSIFQDIQIGEADDGHPVVVSAFRKV